MLALVILQTLVVAILVVLVVGLLRSHGDVLRRLHELGVPLGGEEPAAIAGGFAAGAGLDPEGADIARRLHAGVAPPKATPTVARDISGVTPGGGAVQVSLAGAGRLTLLAFLSSGCGTCAGFWHALRDGQRLQVHGRDVRVVVVTGGPQHESPRSVAALAADGVTTVMSAEAWEAYGVPATPYFVLVDGEVGVVGEGSSSGWPQLAGLMERALADRGFASGVAAAPGAPTSTAPGGNQAPSRLNGPERDARADAALLAAGIGPGDERLYQSPLEELP